MLVVVFFILFGGWMGVCLFVNLVEGGIFVFFWFMILFYKAFNIYGFLNESILEFGIGGVVFMFFFSF